MVEQSLPLPVCVLPAVYLRMLVKWDYHNLFQTLNFMRSSLFIDVLDALPGQLGRVHVGRPVHSGPQRRMYAHHENRSLIQSLALMRLAIMHPIHIHIYTPEHLYIRCMFFEFFCLLRIIKIRMHSTTHMHSTTACMCWHCLLVQNILTCLLQWSPFSFNSECIDVFMHAVRLLGMMY